MARDGAPITHARILRIAVPIVLSNATVPILGAVDTGVVGQMGLAAPIGAVGIGTVVLTTFYWVFGFLRMGTTGLVAQARGAGDAAEAGRLFLRGLVIAFLAGGALVAAQAAIFAGAFLAAPASEEVEGLARQYLAIRIWGAPATIGLYVVVGWLIAVERTRGVLALQVVMNGLNAALDLWFVLGLGWGVEGVAVATLIAEWTGLALGLWLCRGNFRGGAWRDPAGLLDPARLRLMLAVNGDILVRSLVLHLAFTAFLFLSADFGDLALAANQVLFQFLEITAYALDGFAFAAEALVGGAVGAGARERLRRASAMTAKWGLGAGVLLGLGFYAAGPWLIDLMAASPEVRLEARAYLPWILLAPVIGAPAWMLDGIYFGATWTREMRQAVLLSAAVYGAALALLVPAFGAHGLWAALMVLNVARGATLGWRYPALERRVGAPSG